MKHSYTFSSNAMRLRGREWAALFALFLVLFFSLPRLWYRWQKIEPPSNFRLPHEMSNDYYMVRRWKEIAQEQYDVLLLGDSVVWGHYTERDGTLSAHLNDIYGGEVFANNGIDGMHPAAMSGMLKYYGSKIEDKKVILHLNFLWMSSPEADLSTDKKDIRINHPRLLPQLFNRPGAYSRDFVQLLGVTGERQFLFFSWINHLRLFYFDNLDIKNWTMLNPDENPFSRLKPDMRDYLAEEKRSIPYSEPDALARQTPEWVEPADSLQWIYFGKNLDILQKNGNRLFVIIGPFNPDTLTGEGLERYLYLRGLAESRLAARQIPYYTVEGLPSPSYADATHPFSEGYMIIAERLSEDASFREWLGPEINP